MKAKLLEEYMDIPAGTIVEVREDTSAKYGCDEFYGIVLPYGVVGIYKWRVELLPLSPIEEKKKQIQEAQNLLDNLNKELEELKTPKVGDKYNHTFGCKYILAEVNGQYAFICYDGTENGQSYTKKLHNTIDEAFSGHHQYFKKIS